MPDAGVWISMNADSDIYDSDPFPDWEDDETLTRECTSCGAEVYEDVEQCPVCGEWITDSTSAWSDRPTWWVVLGLLGIGSVLWLFTLGSG